MQTCKMFGLAKKLKGPYRPRREFSCPLNFMRWRLVDFWTHSSEHFDSHMDKVQGGVIVYSKAWAASIRASFSNEDGYCELEARRLKQDLVS